jgi:hypothetical protein
VPDQQVREVVVLAGVEAGLGPAAAVVVLTDEHGVREDDLVAGRGVHLEGDVRPEVALVEAVPVDLEVAADVRLVVGMAVERDAVDLDGAVVALGVRLGECRRRPSQCDRAHAHTECEASEL